MKLTQRNTAANKKIGTEEEEVVKKSKKKNRRKKKSIADFMEDESESKAF